MEPAQAVENHGHERDLTWYLGWEISCTKYVGNKMPEISEFFNLPRHFDEGYDLFF